MVRTSFGFQIASLALLVLSLAASLPPVAARAQTPAPLTVQPPAFTGVWTSNPADADNAIFDDLGLGWARVSVIWASIEKTRGVFDWTDLDRQVVAASGDGRRRVLALVRNNPAWAATARCRVTSDAERVELASFVGALVGRYRGLIPDGKYAGHLASVGYWQLYNEPDNTSLAFDTTNDLGGCFGTLGPDSKSSQDGRDQYAATIQSAGLAIHAADPSAWVVAGGTVSGNFTDLASASCPLDRSCIFDRDFLAGVLTTLGQSASLDQLDAVAVHYFSSQSGTWRSGGRDLVGRVAALRQMMADVGLPQPKPIVVDELSFTDANGTSNANPSDAFNVAQRAYVTKSVARGAAVGIAAQLWFWLRDAHGGLGSDVPYGILDQSGAQKPAYAALAYASRTIGAPGAFVGVPTTLPSPDFEAYAFTTASGARVEVIWNEDHASEAVYSPSPATVVAVTDPSGTPVPFNADGARVGTEPRYVFLANASP